MGFTGIKTHVTALGALALTLGGCGIGQFTKVVVVTATPSPTVAATAVPMVQATSAPTSAPQPTSAPHATSSAATSGPSQNVNTLFQYGPINPAQGQGGAVPVVEQGPYSNSLPVVVVNNTGGVVSAIKITGEVHDASGKLIASGSDQGVLPDTLPPGKHAIGYVYFDGRTLPAGATFKLDTTFDNGPDQYATSLAVSQVSVTGNQIVGEVKNTSTLNLDGPLAVMALCFDTKGQITGEVDGFAQADKLAAGASSSFALDLNDLPCPGYLVGGSGHNP